MSQPPLVNEVWCLGVATRPACILYCITHVEEKVSSDTKKVVVAKGVDLSTGQEKGLVFHEAEKECPSGWVGWTKVD